MSEDTVNSKTVNRFKNQIDPWFKQHGGLYIGSGVSTHSGARRQNIIGASV